MCAELNFNAQGIDPADTFEPVPTDWYPVVITESQIKATKNETGAYLELKLQIQGGDYDKRVAFARLNLQNSNPVAVEIAQRQLSAICHAVQVMQVADSSQLHGRPLLARIVYRPEKKDEMGNVIYEPSNDVKGFKPIDAGAAASAAPAFATAASAPPTTATPAAAAAPAPAPETSGPTMTAKANGVSYDAFIAQGWTDDLLLEHGYIEAPSPATAVPPSAAAPPAAAAAPPAGAAAPTAAGKPPWQQ